MLAGGADGYDVRAWDGHGVALLGNAAALGFAWAAEVLVREAVRDDVRAEFRGCGSCGGGEEDYSQELGECLHGGCFVEGDMDWEY